MPGQHNSRASGHDDARGRIGIQEVFPKGAPLAVGELVVPGHHPVGPEGPARALHQLRNQSDLRHHQQHVLSLLEGVGREVQVDLGLARPRGAPEHLRKRLMLLGLELLKRRRLRRAELRQQQGIPEIHTAVQGTQFALEDSPLDQGRKVGRLDVRVFGGEGRHSNPGVAVVFGLGLEGQLKVAQQGFGLKLGAR